MRAHRLLLVPALAVAAVAAGCGGTESEPAPRVLPPLAHEALPELTARDRALPARELAQDALAPSDLAALLAAAGYLGGAEREFSGHTDTFDHVVARTLTFADVAGANAYLDWIAGHTGDFVGPSRPLVPIALGAERAQLFELDSCPTCKKQLPTWFAAWRRGTTVSYLLTAGRNVDRRSFGSLARRLEPLTSETVASRRST
ncbi:hypothetical protein [Gaiella sp.]|uniref:hypothetical protein n=1 Tax=Gaiella sp. TaxID=2663207 RepID=UPI003266543F